MNGHFFFHSALNSNLASLNFFGLLSTFVSLVSMGAEELEEPSSAESEVFVFLTAGSSLSSPLSEVLVKALIEVCVTAGFCSFLRLLIVSAIKHAQCKPLLQHASRYYTIA